MVLELAILHSNRKVISLFKVKYKEAVGYSDSQSSFHGYYVGGFPTQKNENI